MNKLINAFEDERLRSARFGIKGEGFYFFELVATEETVFLKTIIPSRKATKKYLKG